MKKIVPILLAVALALALCLVGFADAERYDDDPLEPCPKLRIMQIFLSPVLV